MAILIGCVSQKGGVGKSTIARLIGREFAAADYQVLIADTDNKQTTSTDWVAARNDAGHKPIVDAMPSIDLSRVPASNYDLIIYDGQPASSKMTLEIARLSSLMVIPTGCALDDLKPSVLLAHELVTAGIPRERFAFVLNRVGTDLETAEAVEYLRLAGYRVIAGSLPEQPGYRMAQNNGLALTETRFESLNVRAAEVAQGIIDLIGERHGGDKDSEQIPAGAAAR